MKPYRLYVFSRKNGGGEFVVISDLDEEVVDLEYNQHGQFTLDESVEIDGDATSFPCDRALSAAI